MTTFNGITFEVFPFPQSVDFRESLSTKTNILTPKKGVISEQRISIRPVPRQGFAYEVPLITEKIQSRFAALMHGWQKLYFGLPIWHEKEIHTATISASATTITVDTRYADYRDASLAIIWKSITEYEVVEIEIVEATVLNLASPLVGTFTGTKLIMPLRIAQVTDVINISNPIADYATIQVNFIVKDNVLLAGYVPNDTYNGLPVLTEASIHLSGSNKDSSIDSDSFSQDYGTGDFNYYSDSQFNINTQSWGFLNETKAALWNFRLFLHSLYGMQKCVYIPTFIKNLTQAETIGAADTSIVVENIKLADNMGLNDLRTHLAFIFPDGTILKREITGITETDADTETIDIDSALGVEVAVDDCCISFLDCCRRASDDITIDHIIPYESHCMLSFTACKEPAPVVIPSNYPTLQIADGTFEVLHDDPELLHTIPISSIDDLNAIYPKITPTAVAYYSSTKKKITTAAAHGLTAGDSITFFNTLINGTTTSYNGRTYTVQLVVDATNFTISSSYTTYGTLTGVIVWNKDITGNYYLTNDIDASATITWNDGKGWIPLGSSDYPFRGTLDGCGYTITGLTANWSSIVLYELGLFYSINNPGVVANLTLENVDITGYYGTGGIAGYAFSADGSLMIHNCHVSGVVSGSQEGTGGFVGACGSGEWDNPLSDPFITDCTSNCIVNGYSYVGGFVGTTNGGKILNCRALGNVIGSDYGIGGFVGKVYGTTFEDCCADGDVEGEGIVGGFYGNCGSYSCSAGYGTFIRCRAIGNVAEMEEYGFICGGFGTDFNDSEAENCYAWGNVSAVGEFCLKAGFIACVEEGLSYLGVEMKVFYAGFYPLFFEDEFIKRGHIFKSKSLSKNVFRTCTDDILNDTENVDLLIMHPSCSLIRFDSDGKGNAKHIAYVTNYWNELVSNMAKYKVPKICIESYSLYEKAASIIAKPTQTLQIIDENNIVNLWLKNLPEIVLKPVETDDSQIDFFRRMYDAMRNHIERIRTYQALATLMAEQWCQNE